jgi:hypothetical protein
MGGGIVKCSVHYSSQGAFGNSKKGSHETRPSLQQNKATEIVKSCGVEPLGIQHGLGFTPDLFLFTDEHGSTVGVPLASISESAVRAKLLESKCRWDSLLEAIGSFPSA